MTSLPPVEASNCALLPSLKDARIAYGRATRNAYVPCPLDVDAHLPEIYDLSASEDYIRRLKERERGKQRARWAPTMLTLRVDNLINRKNVMNYSRELLGEVFQLADTRTNMDIGGFPSSRVIYRFFC